MNPDVRREVCRKTLHLSMGGFAFALRWLTPLQAAGCAAFALIFNLTILPRIGGRRLERPAEQARGYSGMIGYPAVVLAVILLSAFALPGFLALPKGALLAGGVHSRIAMAVAAGAWAILAFGDSIGALCGLFLGGPALPWNRRKTWTGLGGMVLAGTASCFGMLLFFLHDLLAEGEAAAVCPYSMLGLFAGAAAVTAAVVESLPEQIDDNLTVPLAAWLVLSALPRCVSLVGGGSSENARVALDAGPLSIGFGFQGAGALLGLLALNLLLALASLALGWVDRASCLLGLLIGLCVIMGMGWPGYAFLLFFYVLSHTSTYYGKRVKRERGIEEDHGGQRRSGSVFSKGFVPAVLAFFSPLGAVAALAVYTADTTATEFGKTSRGKAYSLLPPKSVPHGTAGAISLKGTAAGLIAIGLFAAALGPFVTGILPLIGEAEAMRLLPARPGAVVWFYAAAATLAFFLESAANAWNERAKAFSKVVLHLFIGGAAAALLYLLPILASFLPWSAAP